MPSKVETSPLKMTENYNGKPKHMKPMQKCKIQIMTLLMAIVLTIVGFLALFLGGVPYKGSALNTAGLSSATKVGGGDDLWNSSSQTFNGKVLKDLKEKVFGTEDPTAYIKANGTAEYARTGAYVLPASTINTKAGNAQYGLVVKLGGIDWMVTSATIARGEKEGDIVVTLYQANTTTKTTQFYTSASNTKGPSMYASSVLRKTLLTDSAYSLFSNRAVNGFASRFLVSPADILYQEVQNAPSRRVDGYPYNDPNDAYGEPPGQWMVKFSPSDTQDGIRYDAWKDDYIWIPSFPEVGAEGYIPTASVWNLTPQQRSHTSTANCWLRSGGVSPLSQVLALTSGGALDYHDYLTNSCYIRPAIHLNFGKIAAAVELEDPTDVPTTYNGGNQTVKTIYDADNAAASWYASEWYEHASNYVTLTYYAANGATVTGAKDAGEYWVKAEIQQKWIDDTNAEVEADGKASGWTPQQIADEKEARRPRFAGTPNTSDSAHSESDTVRWFKLTVKPKEVTVTKPAYNVSTGVLTKPTFANTGELYADAPVLATRITGNAANGTKYNEINTLPTIKGTYTAQAILMKSATDETAPTNYVIKDAANCSCTITINATRLAIVEAPDNSKPYTGEEISFPLAGYNSAWAQNASLTLPAGVTLKGSDSEGWSLAVTGVGSYEITASINADKSADYCWNVADKTQEPTAPRTFTITVTKRVLLVDFLSSTGSFLSQYQSPAIYSAEPNNAIDGDEVKLTLSYSLRSSATKIPVPSGSLDVSTLSQGSYYLYATLDDSIADNKNYQLDSGEVSQEFTISAIDISIDSVNWRYSLNNGAVVPIASSEGTSSSSPFTVPYGGGAYVFKVDTADFADRGLKVDTAYGVGGYQNAMQTNAMTSPVAVTVRIVPLEDSFAFNDENGNKLPNQYIDFTIYVQITRADADFSQVKWAAEELEFNGINQRMNIESGFPSYLTPTYGGDEVGREVKDYTVRVTGITVKDSAVAANYNIPTASALSSIPELTHNWKITKKKIAVSWISSETNEGDTVIWIPALSDNTTGAVQYKYYAEDRTTEKTLDEIFSEYDAANKKTYYVCAYLKASGGTFNATNCILVETDGSEVTESFNSFQVGDNKNPVRVGLVSDHVVYNGEEQPVDIDFEGGTLTKENFSFAYKLKGTDGTYSDCGTPKNAGEYQVTITLTGAGTGDYAITGTRVFDYVIEKASYDLSGYRWVDEENENAEYTEPYVWAYGKSHTLKYAGEAIDGLTIGYSAETEEHLTGSDAGDYLVTVQFEVRDTLNYNVPDELNFTWKILPFTPDLSEVQWNYTKEGPFVFTIENGVKKEFEAKLVGLPEGMEQIIVYGEDDGKYADAGSHVTTFAINETHEMRKNFGQLVFGAGVESRLVWEIKSLTVEKPEAKQTKTYRDEGYTFGEITNLPDDFAQYFDVQVLDSFAEEIAPTDGTWKFVNSDTYRILIKFLPGMNKNNGGSFDNVKWSDNGRGSYKVDLKIEKLVFDVEGWENGVENGRPELKADEETLAAIEKYFDYVIINAETKEELAPNPILEYGTSYTIALRLKEGYSGNVGVNYEGSVVEETPAYLFRTEDDPLAVPPEHFYPKPTEEELTVTYRYTGSEIAFEFGAWFDGERMMVLDGVMKGTEEGEYLVQVGFKRGSLAAWLPDEEPYDRAPITVKFVISSKVGDRFILKDGITVPFVFLYDDFSSVGAIEDYAFDADKLAYVSRLSLGDTLSALLSQFENGADITVYDLDGTTVITDYSTVVATGMYLRLMDGDTMLNQLILSVLGEITGDGIINLKDKAQLNSYTLGTTKLAPAQLLASDITGDGIINLKDKAQLNSYTLGTNALPVTPITVPAPSSVSEVVENAEVAETPVPVSLSEVTEEVPARATSAKAVKAGFTTVTTDHRASTSQFIFPPDYAKKKYLK